MIASSNEEIEDKDTQPNHPDHDLETPKEDLLHFISSQHHTEDQLYHVSQTYQAYTDSHTPSREVNAHLTYYGAEAKQAKHGSLVDRGANGGLAGPDVRVLSISPRKCNVTGIDNYEIPGLDIVQCAALVDTNDGIVNHIMHEYA